MAAVDTGFWPWWSLVANASDTPRLRVRYDAIIDELHHGGDLNGHGTHVLSVILDSAGPTGQPGVYNGVAPGAGLLSVKAFDTDGRGSYINIIRGIDWAVAHKDVYNIRVLNLSFSAAPQSSP